MTREGPSGSLRSTVRPRPRGGRALESLRLPSFWILCGLLAVGSWHMAGVLYSSLARYPAATFSALMLFTVWAVPFVLFITAMDFMEREPPLMLTAAFAWGAVVATTAAVPGNRALIGLTTKLASPEFALVWGAAVAGPLVEEVLKALGLVMVVLVARQQINSVLDGLVYGALIGLGFQVVENILYSLNAVEMANRGDSADPVIAIFFLRGFLAGLWSHALFSALAGAGIAWFLVRVDQPLVIRYGGLVAGLVLAWGIHFIWNSPLLVDGPNSSGGGLLLGLMLKGVPALALALGLLYAARKREANFYVDELEKMADGVIATQGELETLRYGYLRADARRYAKIRRGVAGYKAVKALQIAQAKLAVELTRVPEGLVSTDPTLVYWRFEVVLLRDRLADLAIPEATASPKRPTVPRIGVLGIALAIVLSGLVWFAIATMHGG
jgi:protease PrsW